MYLFELELLSLPALCPGVGLLELSYGNSTFSFLRKKNTSYCSPYGLRQFYILGGYFEDKAQIHFY